MNNTNCTCASFFTVRGVHKKDCHQSEVKKCEEDGCKWNARAVWTANGKAYCASHLDEHAKGYFEAVASLGFPV